MHKHTETIFIDTDSKIFAKRLTKVTTTWTLEELMVAADVPASAKVSGYWHYDEYNEEHELGPNCVVLERIQYFDEKGCELMEVREVRHRNVSQAYYETTYRAMTSAEIQAATESRKAKPTPEEAAQAATV